MTPTTVDVPIVAAAANAGFMAELAGGGQVNAAVFDERMEELSESLEPGAEVVFNALYLDRYLWGLHFEREGLVWKAARRGAPLCGVTISAGIPETDEAVALLDQLAEAGLWLNAFKPGTPEQVRQVIQIARAARQPPFVHLEGGKAGGHHSWEDLDDLLLDTYAALRREPNLILCVAAASVTRHAPSSCSRARGRRSTGASACRSTRCSSARSRWRAPRRPRRLRSRCAGRCAGHREVGHAGHG